MNTLQTIDRPRISKETLGELRTKRVNKLKERLMRGKQKITVERAKLVTEAYQMYERDPVIIKRAKAFQHILENMPIGIADGELIVGGEYPEPRCAQIFCEEAVDFIENELFHGVPFFFHERPSKFDRFYASEEVKKELPDIIKYWKEKCHQARCYATFPEIVNKACAMGAINVYPWTFSGDGHLVPNNTKVLKIGLKGILEEAKKELENLDFSDPEDLRKKPFYEAVIIALNASIDFAHRYAHLAEELAKREKDEIRRKELERIAEICYWVPENPARNFYEALQSIFFVHLLPRIEDISLATSLGRLDQTLYPYYQRDVESGILTREFARELLECFWIKLNEEIHLIGWEWQEYGMGGLGSGSTVTIGGRLVDGGDGTNEISYLMLETEAAMRLPSPYFAVRYHDGTPDDFLLKVVDVMCLGGGKPAIFSDEAIIPAMMNVGFPYEDAVNYSLVGCIEPSIEGKQGYRCNGTFYFNACKVLEITLYGGKDPRTGYQLLPLQKNLAQFSSFEELMEAYKEQIKFYQKLGVIGENIIDLSFEELLPRPLISALVDDCIKRGKTIKQGGAIYDIMSDQEVGWANVADSLAVIKKLVFEDKTLTGEQLLHAMATNFEDESTTPTGEEIRRMCLEVTKYGNDDDYVDSIINEVMTFYANELFKLKNTRYGRGPSKTYNWQPSTSSMASNIPLGKYIGATPDGRKKGMPVADGVSPYMGADKKGPTAVAKSVGKTPNFLMAGGQLLNQKFSVTALEGAGRKKLAELIRTYEGDLKGMQVQINIEDAATYRDAQEHPEKYGDLLVRVAGWTAYFTSLSRELQDVIIQRTEHTL